MKGETQIERKQVEANLFGYDSFVFEHKRVSDEMRKRACEMLTEFGWRTGLPLDVLKYFSYYGIKEEKSCRKQAMRAVSILACGLIVCMLIGFLLLMELWPRQSLFHIGIFVISILVIWMIIYTKRLIVTYHRVHKENIGLAFRNVIAVGNLTGVRKLLEHGVNPKSAIALAAQCGHIEVMKCLIEAGADIQSNDEALRSACAAGHLEIVYWLLDKSAHVTSGAIEIAAQNGHLEVVRLLVKADVNIRHNLVEALRAAYTGGHSDIVRWLLDNGANINDIDGRSALSAAIEFDNVALLELLLSRGVNVKGVNIVRLFMKCRNNFSQCEDLLLKHGGVINPLNKSEWDVDQGKWVKGSVLLFDVETPEAARFLLRHGANPNVRYGGDYGDYTPLYAHVKRRFDWDAGLRDESVGKDREAILEVLIEHGADPTLKTKTGDTALKYAKRAWDDGSNKNVYRILFKYKSKNKKRSSPLS